MEETNPAPAPEERRIYMLVVLFRNDNNKDRRSRTWGWFSSFNEAKEVFENHVEIHMECGYYNYAVIEEVEEGSHSWGKPLVWYHAECLGYGDYKLTVLDEPPEFARNVCNFWS